MLIILTIVRMNRQHVILMMLVILMSFVRIILTLSGTLGLRLVFWPFAWSALAGALLSMLGFCVVCWGLV